MKMLCITVAEFCFLCNRKINCNPKLCTRKSYCILKDLQTDISPQTHNMLSDIIYCTQPSIDIHVSVSKF